MNGPAAVPARKLWEKLQELPRPSQVVDFPRLDFAGNPIGQLRIWVLDQEERIDCAAAAENYARRKLKDAKATDLGYEDVYSNEVSVQILWRACRDVDDVTRAAWPTPDLLRKITSEECAVLFQHYLTVQQQFGPIIAEMKEGDLDAWVKRLAEGGSAFPFDLLSSDMQKILVLGMASRLHALQTATSSAGTSPEASSPSGSAPVPADDEAALHAAADAEVEDLLKPLSE